MSRCWRPASPATLEDPRSGRRYSACSVDAPSTLSMLGSNPGRARPPDRLRAAVRTRPRALPDDVRERLRAVEQARRRRLRGGRSTGSSSVVLSRDGHSRALRAPEPAVRTTWPVRRRIAPVDAPLTSSAPAKSSVPPTIAAPVSPIRPASAPPSARPIQPPLSFPSSVMSPRKPTPRPRRNGPHVEQLAPREHESADATSTSGSP